MEKRHYSRRTESVRRYSAARRRSSSENNYFFIKANICLGIVICTLAAVSMENDRISAGCEKLAELIGTSTTGDELAKEGESLLAVIKGEGGGIYTFAGEKDNIKLSDDIKSEIKQRSNVYEQNNKGAPQKSGLLPLTE